jgi:hypothetical protein
MAILKTGHNPSANSGAGGFVTDEQVTAAKLNAAINSATLESGIADGTTLEVNSGAIRIADNGVTQAKLDFVSDAGGAMTLQGTGPSLSFNDTDLSYADASEYPQLDGASTNLNLKANKSGSEITFNTNSVLRLQVGEDVAKDAAGTGSQAGIKVTNDIYATGDISADGDVVASLSSDIRLKENVTPIVDAIDKVNELSGCTFKWKDCATYNGDDVGVIAQEVQKVIPSAVKERHDGYLKVDYTRLVPLLLESIKELSQKIEILEEKSHTHGIKK